MNLLHVQARADPKSPGAPQWHWDLQRDLEPRARVTFESKMRQSRLSRRLSYFSKLIYGTKFISDFQHTARSTCEQSRNLKGKSNHCFLAKPEIFE